MTDAASLGLEDRTARVVAGQRVWDELTPSPRSTLIHHFGGGRYVGSRGGDLIKLDRGSSIIVDASVATVRAGSTDLAFSLNGSGAGVGVYSWEACTPR